MRLLRYIPALSVLAAGFMAMPSWAEEAEKAKAGLPQLDAQYFPGQIFWLAVTFALLYTVMAWIVLPRVQQTQKKRQVLVAEELAIAKSANEEAKKMAAGCDAILADARCKAIALEDISKTRQEALKHQSEQQKVLTQQILKAEVRIGNARDAALLNVQKMSVEIANDILEKITTLKIRVKA